MRKMFFYGDFLIECKEKNILDRNFDYLILN